MPICAIQCQGNLLDSSLLANCLIKSNVVITGTTRYSMLILFRKRFQDLLNNFVCSCNFGIFFIGPQEHCSTDKGKNNEEMRTMGKARNSSEVSLLVSFFSRSAQPEIPVKQHLKINNFLNCRTLPEPVHHSQITIHSSRYYMLTSS